MAPAPGSREEGGATRHRKRVFGCLALLLVLLAVEASSFLLLSLARGRWMTHGRVRDLQLGVAGGSERPPDGEASERLDIDLEHEAVHPYLGFVLDRRYRAERRREKGGGEALDFGFELQQPGIFHPPREDRPVLAVTGGSLAFAFAGAAGDQLRDELLGGLPGYEQAVVVNLALPGYKQPQQLMTLSYFLALGAHFDVVVNVDGFNEVVLPAAENLPSEVYPFYPRLWSFRAGELEPARRIALGKLAFLDERRRRWAELGARAPYRFSLTAGLLWTAFDRVQRRAIETLELELRRAREGLGETLTVSGPSWPDRGPEATYRELAALWARASEQMHLLAAGQGIRYFHFLQPNQYLPGSKPIGPEERATSLEDGHPYGRHVPEAYPILIEQGRELAARGVRFFDLTGMFAAVEAPVYRDACCHLNALGETLLARQIAAAMRRDLLTTPPPGLEDRSDD